MRIQLQKGAIMGKQKEAALKWKQHVKSQEISGLTQEKFCEINSLNPHTLKSWKTKFRKQQAAAFVRVDFSNSAKKSNYCEFKLVFTSKIHFEFSSQPDINWLCSLVNELQEKVS